MALIEFDPLARLEHAARRHARLAHAIALTRACLDRLVEIQFVDRSIALGSLGFTALVPLLVIASAFLPGTDGLANELIERFHLHGSTAQLVREVFAQPDAVRQSVSWLGVLLLVGASLSFTRGLQRVYERAWRLEARGLAGTKSGLIWIAGIVVWSTLFASARDSLLDLTGPLASLIILLTGDAIMWLWSPWILLARRVDWRQLVPTALLTAVAMTAISIGSVIYMPEAIGRSATHYGPIGIAIALVSWLVGVGFALTLCAGIGAVLGGEWDGPDAPIAAELSAD
ncbi:MAG TPA: YhjD/YihY/BrkB family envelope integrity protein [Conexibacter sp.]|nr:YhjD/YihY/BrkB family envelope integrity protein [Conexibacter sp.]